MNWDYLNPNWLLSRLLEKIGIDTYLSKVEFAAHLGWSIAVALLGYLVSPIIIIAWVIWHIYDEFLIDGFKGSDTYWDLGSKLIIPVITGALLWVF